MGAYDIFEIVATGKGAHAAMPHLGNDPMLFAAHVINALQTIVSRNLHPLDAGVVSVTQVHGGDTWNVIPQESRAARHRAHVQARRPGHDRAADEDDRRRHRRDVRDDGHAALRAALSGDRQQRDGNAACDRRRHGAGRRRARRHRSDADMASEDFAFMLQAKPGCYLWLGVGAAKARPTCTIRATTSTTTRSRSARATG